MAKRTNTGSGEGFEISISGIRVSLGKGGAWVLATAVAAILYAIARSL